MAQGKIYGHRASNRRNIQHNELWPKFTVSYKKESVIVQNYYNSSGGGAREGVLFGA